MIVICPRCKKLIDESLEECPHCGKRFATTNSLRARQWWCNYCEMYINPITGSSPVGSVEFVLGLSKALQGDIGSAYIAGELGNLKNKISSNPDNYRCPKCGGNNLQKWKPIDLRLTESNSLQILKTRLANGEISTSEYLELKKLLDED